MLLLVLAHLPVKIVPRNARLDSRDHTRLALLACTLHNLCRARDAHLLRLREDGVERCSRRRAGGWVVFLKELDEQIDIFERLVCALAEVLNAVVQYISGEGYQCRLTGLVGCAASPTSRILPLCQVLSSGRSYKPY